MLAAPAIGVATFAWFGLYRLVTRYITIRGSGQLLQCIGVSVLFWALLALLSRRDLAAALGDPGALSAARRRTDLRQPADLRGGAALGRRAARAGRTSEPRPVVIYGAGRTGVQLLDALHNSGDARVAGFLDDTASLWGQYAGGRQDLRARQARAADRAGGGARGDPGAAGIAPAGAARDPEGAAALSRARENAAGHGGLRHGPRRRSAISGRSTSRICSAAIPCRPIRRCSLMPSAASRCW